MLVGVCTVLSKLTEVISGNIKPSYSFESHGGKCYEQAEAIVLKRNVFGIEENESLVDRHFSIFNPLGIGLTEWL